MSNLEKYALGFQGDPRTPVRLWGDDGLMFGFWTNDSSSGFRYRTDTTRDDAEVAAEWSQRLESWTSAGLVVTEEEQEGDLMTWRVSLPGGLSSAFFRMSVSAEE